MNDMSLLKQDTAFHKLFLLFKQRYESLGRIGGSVSLKKFSNEEITAISGLTGFSEEELLSKQSISLLRFEKALQQTKYQYGSLLLFLETYFGEPLVANKDRLSHEKEQEALFAENMKTQFPSISWYIKWISGKPADSRWVWSLYKDNSAALIIYFSLLEKAYLSLLDEKSFIRMPLFAQKITGNPHAFDKNEALGKMLLHLLTVDQMNKRAEIVFSKTTEEENDLLGMYGLLRDDLWSFVTTQNLAAEIDGSIHPVWKSAYETKTVLNIPLKELIKVDAVHPFEEQTVWVVENSSVASTLMDLVPNVSIVCTHGQLRIAGWRLIELLAASSVPIYYSGDLDPEGMLIADRLVSRYPQNIHLWRMDAKTYLERMSDEQISETRLNKLNKLHHPELKEIAKWMNEHKKAAYQEAVVELLVLDMDRQGE